MSDGWPEVRLLEPEEGIAFTVIAILCGFAALAALALYPGIWPVFSVIQWLLNGFLMWDILRGWKLRSYGGARPP